MQLWIKHAILSVIKKNYNHKKSGVRLTLDDKHEWDRVVKPIEHAIGKVLVVHPYHPPVVAIEGSQAMLMMLKSGSALPLQGRTFYLSKNIVFDENGAIAAKSLGKERKGADHNQGSNIRPDSPQNTAGSRPGTADSYTDSPASSRPATAETDSASKPATAAMDGDGALKSGYTGKYAIMT